MMVALHPKHVSTVILLCVEICRRTLSQTNWFTPAMLLEKAPSLKLVIDLTQTNRYYDKEDLEMNGVRHKKIWCPGGGKQLPTRPIIHEFYRTVERFLSTEYDGLIGVHCTHGLNRTGFLICKFMVTHGMPAKDAIVAFESARGHEMERDLYIRDILGTGLAQRSPSPKGPARPATSGSKYRSPRDAPNRNFREKRPKTTPEAGGSRSKKLKCPEPAFQDQFKNKMRLNSTSEAGGSHSKKSDKYRLPEHGPESKLKHDFLEKRLKETSVAGRFHSDKCRPSEPTPESKLKPSSRVERTSPLDNCYSENRANYSNRKIFYPTF